MQTAVACNGSNSSSSTSITTTSATIVEDSNREPLPFGAVTSTVIVTTPPAGGAEQPHLLLHRLPAEKSNASFVAFGTVLAQKNGNARRLDTAEFLGSKVEQMSATPSPSPQASPSKKCIHSLPLPLPPVTAPEAVAVGVSAATSGQCPAPAVASLHTSSIVGDGAHTGNGSSSSSSSTSNSNSTTSSVIASPVLVRNGNAFLQDGGASVGNGRGCGSGDGNSKRRSVERNELLATKTLPLSSIAATCATFDESHFTRTEMFTPLTPTPSSSTSISPTSITTTASSATPASSTPATTPAPSKSPSMEAKLLHWQDMPQYLQFNPYVLKGYRPLQTFKGCLLSLFYWHNETINILTHAIPIVYILAIVPGLMPWEKGYRFLSFCHVFGSVAPWCGSFVYHLFMNIERGENVYYRLLKLDMVGIWVSQSFGALPLVTATTFCFSYKWRWFVIASYCLMCLWGLYKALTASSPWQRRLCFALPFTMRSILTFLRTMGLVGGNRVALSHVYLQDGVSIIGGAIGAMRIPEKWFPGLVDYYLNSHNIMHVLVVVAVYSMHKATMKDIEWMSGTNCEAFTNATRDAIGTTLSSNVEL